jgi:hypothetical protein
MLAEKFKIVPILSDQDLNAGASMPGDCLNMAGYHDATFIIGLQTLGGAATYLKLYSGASDGATTTALTFRYAYGGAATGSANADVLAAWATSANLAIAHATKDNFMLIVHIRADEMDTANGHKFLTLQFEDTDTGATGNAQVHAILTPRFTGNRSVTALA